MSSGRSIEQIDQDIDIERKLLEYEARNGRASNSARATWRLIDALLDERLQLMPVLPLVPGLPQAASGPVDGRVVREA